MILIQAGRGLILLLLTIQSFKSVLIQKGGLWSLGREGAVGHDSMIMILH